MPTHEHVKTCHATQLQKATETVWLRDAAFLQISSLRTLIVRVFGGIDPVGGGGGKRERGRDAVAASREPKSSAEIGLQVGREIREVELSRKMFEIFKSTAREPRPGQAEPDSLPSTELQEQAQRRPS